MSSGTVGAWLDTVPRGVYARPQQQPDLLEDLMQSSIEKLRHTGWEKFERMPAQSPIGATIHRSLPSEHGFADTASGARDFYRQHPTATKPSTIVFPFIW